MSKTILVTGADGQLGRELRRLASSSEDRFLFVNRYDLDLTNSKKVKSYFQQNSIEYCINTAAYTKVDLAESESQESKQVNVEAVSILAEVCQHHEVKLIHLSTDFVFDGERHTPYKEEDYPNPMNVYGKTKLEGEEVLLDELDDAIIVRTSWLYSSFGNNFVSTMLRLGQEHETLKVVSDQIGSPTYAKDLAEALLAMISAKWKSGIYHYSNEGVASWYDFAHSIFEFKGNDRVTVIPIKSKEYPTSAKRPLYTVLDKQKIKKVYNLTIRHWREGLKEMINQ